MLVSLLVAEVFLIDFVHDFVDEITVIHEEIALAWYADNVGLQEGNWTGIFDVEEGIELSWVETEMLDFWFVEIFAYFVVWNVTIKPE